ncbi:MAG: hypothetical protein GKR89_35410 [Candidatus Latescibacteria bacterium]|nr:hypothetical protein [Candidatus Latescibacterota bacterium]
MAWTALLLDFVPLLIFVVVDSFGKTRYALFAAMGAAAFDLGYNYYFFGEIDSLALSSAALILLLGGLSVKFNTPVFFKFKPVIFNLALAVTLFVYYAQDQPLMLYLSDRYANVLPGQFQALLQQPQIRLLLERLSLYLGFGLIVHAGVVAWAALRFGNWWWLGIRSLGLYLMMFVVIQIASIGLGF